MADVKQSVRAAPRRAKKDPNEAPVFLQKTYQMIDQAPTEIASWSENGDTFIVKDMDAFANLLPRFFKHKNFRSFVRQLNFYGFRKLRTDGALISDRPAHWWEFRHDKFKQGHPELLTQIKRANHYEAGPNDQGEVVEDLKSEVVHLRERIDDMSSTIQQLSSLVETLMRERGQQAEDAGAMGAGKKRKLTRESSIDMMRAFEADTNISDVNETLLLSQLSIDSDTVEALADLDAGFDFDGDVPEATVVGAASDSQPLPVAVKTESGSIDMPPVAPYLATAAIGAFFTKLAADQQDRAAAEGVPLVRTTSMGSGIAVQA